MKTKALLLIFVLGDLVGAQSDYVKKLPIVDFELACLNEAGVPLEAVQVTSHDSAIGTVQKFRQGEAVSDENGKCRFRFHALGGVNVYAIKDGYYPSIAPAQHERPIDPRFQFDPFIGEETDPPGGGPKNPPMKKEVNLEASIILREIKNPIPLYGRRVQVDIPARDVWVGYDFELGDWVKPFGKGIQSDMRIRSAPQRMAPKGNGLGSHLSGVAKLEIDFGPGGGMVRVTEENGWLSVSELKMPHSAPEEGYDELPLLQIEQPRVGLDSSSEAKKARGYFFRTRVRREDGEVVRAHYGKLMDRIKYIPVERDEAWLGDREKNLPAFGSLEFIYCFNPKANDRNLEFDVKRNLFPRLDPGEWVRHP